MEAITMRRREFIAAFGGALTAPLTALGQSRPPVIGIISSVPAWSPARPTPANQAFQQALRALGYIEGQTIVLAYRRAAGLDFNDYLVVAEEFVRRRVDVIVASNAPSTLAAKQATQEIPIVFGAFGMDPVELGLAKSLAR